MTHSKHYVWHSWLGADHKNERSSGQYVSSCGAGLMDYLLNNFDSLEISKPPFAH